MKQSIKINPCSHACSEWFHVRFVEAAIEIRDKKINMEDLDVLKLDTNTSMEIGNQMGLQLQERISLTNAPNALLSKAIEEAGDYFKKNISIDWAVKFYAMASGFSPSEFRKKQIAFKINETIERIIVLHKTQPPAGRIDEVRKELIKETAKDYVLKDIHKWENYRIVNPENIKVINF